MDSRIFHMINGLAGKNEFADNLMIAASSYLYYIFIIITLILLFIRSRRQIGLLQLAGIVIGLAINNVISLLYYRERPFVAEEARLLIEKGASASFPSDTALICFVTAVAYFPYYKRYSVLLFLLAALVGFSRVYVGHHYPGDIVGSLLISTALVIALYRIMAKKRFSKQKEISL